MLGRPEAAGALSSSAQPTNAAAATATAIGTPFNQRRIVPPRRGAPHDANGDGRRLTRQR
ncbi:hypothetical protein GCM10009668_07160 [Nocardioides dubius]|uniref:Uncharacterized protein n=1 Tax=Nocardioides dubius TaxID=317019 RepID=A0ABN1TMD3_9ACTN